MNESHYNFLKSLKDQIMRTTTALKKQYEQEAQGNRDPFAVQMREDIPDKNGNKKSIALELKPQGDVFKAYCEKVRRIIYLHLHTYLHAQEKNTNLALGKNKYPFTIAQYKMLLKSERFSCWLNDTIVDSFNQLLIKTHSEAIGILRFILIERIFSCFPQTQPTDAEDNQSAKSSIVHIQMEQLVSSHFNDISALLNSLPDYITATPENARKMSPNCTQEYYASLRRAYGFLAHFGIYNFTLSQHFVLSDDASAEKLRLDVQLEKNQKILERQDFNDSNILKFFVLLQTKENYVVEIERAARKPLPLSERIEESASENVSPLYKTNNRCQFFGWFSLFRKNRTASLQHSKPFRCSNQIQEQDAVNSEVGHQFTANSVDTACR